MSESEFRLITDKKVLEKYKGAVSLNFFKHFHLRASFIGIVRDGEIVSLCAY